MGGLCVQGFCSSKQQKELLSIVLEVFSWLPKQGFIISFLFYNETDKYTCIGTGILVCFIQIIEGLEL